MQNEKPLVSIIVPCFNQATFMAETLDSVLAQTYANWECVLVNDGSTDNTEKIAQSYCAKDNRFIYVSQQNQGLAATRNNGILVSHGKYIIPLDSDDIIGESYLEKAVDKLECDSSIKVVYCLAKRFGIDNRFWKLPNYDYKQLLWQNLIFCSAMYRRVDYDKTPGYHTNMKEGLEDWDFWLSLLKENDKVVRIDEILFYYRIKSGSMLLSLRDKEKAMMTQIYNNHKELYQDKVEDVIYQHYYADMYDKTKLELERLRRTKAYQLGKFILHPISFFRDKKTEKLFG